jgi:hypothetical protein
MSLTLCSITLVNSLFLSLKLHCAEQLFLFPFFVPLKVLRNRQQSIFVPFSLRNNPPPSLLLLFTPGLTDALSFRICVSPAPPSTPFPPNKNRTIYHSFNFRDALMQNNPKRCGKSLNHQPWPVRVFACSCWRHDVRLFQHPTLCPAANFTSLRLSQLALAALLASMRAKEKMMKGRHFWRIKVQESTKQRVEVGGKGEM